MFCLVVGILLESSAMLWSGAMVGIRAYYACSVEILSDLSACISVVVLPCALTSVFEVPVELLGTSLKNLLEMVVDVVRLKKVTIRTTSVFSAKRSLSSIPMRLLLCMYDCTVSAEVSPVPLVGECLCNKFGHCRAAMLP